MAICVQNHIQAYYTSGDNSIVYSLRKTLGSWNSRRYLLINDDYQPFTVQEIYKPCKCQNLTHIFSISHYKLCCSKRHIIRHSVYGIKQLVHIWYFLYIFHPEKIMFIWTWEPSKIINIFTYKHNSVNISTSGILAVSGIYVFKVIYFHLWPRPSQCFVCKWNIKHFDNFSQSLTSV